MSMRTRQRRSFYTEDHEAFSESVARFVASEVTPNLEKWRHDGTIPREVFASAGSAGFLGTAVPEQYGGGGADDLGFVAALVEEVASTGALVLAWSFAIQAGLTATVLSEYGCTDRLFGVAAGTTVVAIGNGDLTTTPDRHVSGRLSHIPGARLADLLLVDLGGAGAAVIEIDQPGVSVSVVPSALTAPEAGVADVVLDDAQVAALLPRSFRRELDLWVAVTARAAAAGAMDLGIEYVQARKVFGKPLATFENTRFRLAELSAELITATTFVDSCVSAGVNLSSGDAAAARITAGRLLDNVVDQCLQLHGGYGYMREYPISTAFADARFLRLAVQRFSDPRNALANQLGL